MDRFTKILVWIAVAVSVTAFQFSYISKIVGITEKKESEIFFDLMAVFIMLLSTVIFINFRKNFVAFLLLGLAINNLMDELFFDPLKFELNELGVFVFILIIGYWKYGRKRPRA